MSDNGDIYVDVSLTNFIKEAQEKNVEDEIKYNLMKYVSPNLDYPLDIMVKNITSELKRITGPKAPATGEDASDKVEKALGVSSDRKMIAENVGCPNAVAPIITVADQQ